MGKDKNGNRQVEVTKRIQPMLQVARKIFQNPLKVLRVARKEKVVENPEQIEYDGPKNLDDIKEKVRPATPSKFDAGACLTVKAQEEAE